MLIFFIVKDSRFFQLELLIYAHDGTILDYKNWSHLSYPRGY